MAKAATVQARVDVELKRCADSVLKQLGLSASQVINALYAQIVLQRGVPFDIKLPNEETLRAIAELESGKAKRFTNFKDMLDDAKT